jgi:hypothetical protein
VPSVFYSEKSRCIIVFTTVLFPFSLGVQPSKPLKVKPFIFKGATRMRHHCNRGAKRRATSL